MYVLGYFVNKMSITKINFNNIDEIIKSLFGGVFSLFFQFSIMVFILIILFFDISKNVVRFVDRKNN